MTIGATRAIVIQACLKGTPCFLSLTGSGEIVPTDRAQIFISYAGDDSHVVHQLAGALEQMGYSTWFYERDCAPGASYLLQTGQAIEEAEALVLVISATSMQSHQVTAEVVRAHECNKPLVPVLHGVTHADLQSRQPEWREALAARAAVVFRSDDEQAVLGRIQRGLALLGVQPRYSGSPRSPALSSPPTSTTTVQPIPAPHATVTKSAPVALSDRLLPYLQRPELSLRLTPSDVGRVSQVERLLAAYADHRHFSDGDVESLCIVFRELVDNVRLHCCAHPEKCYVTIRSLEYDTVLELLLTDSGVGFALDDTLAHLVQRLEAGEREHGLLRAVRYGTSLTQQIEPGKHSVCWRLESRPAPAGTFADGYKDVVPVFVDNARVRQVRVAKATYHCQEFGAFLALGDAFLRLVLEPLRRSRAPCIGFQATGKEVSFITRDTVSADPIEVFQAVWRYRAEVTPEKYLVVFVDTECRTHWEMRSFFDACRRGRASFFEDLDECNDFLRSGGWGR